MLQLSPEERAEPVVRALIKAYRDSRHGRTGAGRREYHVRYDKLVHELACAKVAEERRGRLVLERLRAAGLIRWDHIPLQRDQIKTIYVAPASENDLFFAVDETSPGVGRDKVAAVLASHLSALHGHPNEPEWKAALQQAIDDVNQGRSAEGLPIDGNLHGDVLTATAAVLNNRQRIFIRRLSSEKLPHSKFLGERQDAVERFMAQFLTPELATLEAWQVIKAPPVVLMRGPMEIELDDGMRIDELPPDSPYMIKEELLARAQRISTSARRCLSIENQTPFREVAAINSGDLIVQASYPSSTVIRLLQLLPATVRLLHWGDTDPWGYDILRALRERTGRAIAPWRMGFRPKAGPPLSNRESAILSRLIADPLVADLRTELFSMRAWGGKGDFEQDGLPVMDFAKE